MTQTTDTTGRILTESEIRSEIDDWYHVSTLCTPGPTYDACVHQAVVAAELAVDTGAYQSAMHWLVVAAWRAGHLTDADACAQDPWSPR